MVHRHYKYPYTKGFKRHVVLVIYILSFDGDILLLVTRKHLFEIFEKFQSKYHIISRKFGISVFFYTTCIVIYLIDSNLKTHDDVFTVCNVLN